MKPPTVFLGELTNPEVEAFLEHSLTVIVPVGSVEQHGPHAPLLTDVLVPTEVARRVAPRVDAVVAPPVNYGFSYPHVGFTGVAHIRIPTFMALIEDIAVTLAEMGFRRIVFLNGHYDNTYAIAYACAAARRRLPTGTRAFPINYWDGMLPERGGRVLRPRQRPPANAGETSAVMAINPDSSTSEGEPRNAAVPGGHQRGAPSNGVLLLVARLRLSRNAVRHLGRPAPELRRVRPALPGRRGRTPRSGSSTTSRAPRRRCRTAERAASAAWQWVGGGLVGALAERRRRALGRARRRSRARAAQPVLHLRVGRPQRSDRALDRCHLVGRARAR